MDLEPRNVELYDPIEERRSESGIENALFSGWAYPSNDHQIRTECAAHSEFCECLDK
jgi:hypothetical protein